MRKIVFLTLLFLVLCIPITYAEIRTSHDDFSNMSFIISETLNVGKFNSVEVFKQTNGNKTDGAVLFIKCQSTHPPYFKNKAAEIKIDDHLYVLDCLEAKEWPNEDGTMSTDGSYIISNYIIKNLINGRNIAIRVYLYGDDAYETFTVSPDMLSEWNQVLSTNL